MLGTVIHSTVHFGAYHMCACLLVGFHEVAMGVGHSSSSTLLLLVPMSSAV